MRRMKDSGVEWIGEIPEEWEVIPMNRIYIEHKCKNRGNKVKNVLSLSYGRIIPRDVSGNMGLLPESFETYNILEPDNIVLRLTDLQNDQKSLRTGLVKEHGIITSAYMTLKTNCKSDSKYNHYLLHTYDVMKIIYNMGNGVRQNLKYAELSKLPLVVPPFVEQHHIADFLDRKCAQIDTIIAKQQAVIEKLKLYKQSVITEAVTKGLDPDVPMKDSGIEWLGEMPKNWKKYRIANLYDERIENGSDDLPILTVSINSGISDRELSDDEKERAFVRSEDRTKYKRVYPGDLAYNMMRAWQGAFGAVRVDGMISPAYVVARPNLNGVIDSRYIEYLLRTPIATEEMHRYSHGIADFRLRLYWPKFKNIRICLPSLQEQKEIADFIDYKSAKTEDLIKRIQLFIDKLTQYKKSLIYEAVTGKMEV